jgi:hypothetical protein
MEQLRRIPVSELRPGLTVWVETPKGWQPDTYLADYFLSDYPPREFVMGHRLQFKTGSGNQVVWRNCGTVVISVGRAAKQTIRKEQFND